MDFEDEFITQQMEALEHEELDPEVVADFMRELTYLTRKYGVEIASFDDINPFLVKTDCRDGTYTLDDDDELMGLFYAERSMMQ